MGSVNPGRLARYLYLYDNPFSDQKIETVGGVQ